MCGIVGVFNLEQKKVSSEIIAPMIEAIKHRGPDDTAEYIENNLAFGFVRLSILDLSKAGRQPMRSEDGRYVVVFNGEIFNYLELRNELKELGYNFISDSDTEVLLNAYREWGEECLHKFNGMWAFGIYDNVTGSVFFSRDRYGIKPFYYTVHENQFYFSSEIKGLLARPEIKRIPNDEKIYDFLLNNRTDVGTKTFFQNILKLAPGHCISIDKNGIRIHRWYDLRKELKEPVKDASEYFTLLKDAIELRMRSDVPVGVCLSGGLDSSTIASILLLNDDNTSINTFSAVFPGDNRVDESKYINAYSDRLKNMNFISPSGETLYSDLNRLLSLHEEPFPSTSPYLQYKVMECAREKVKVTLDGQGADEQLAGYTYFYGIYFRELFYSFNWLTCLRELISIFKMPNRLILLKSTLFFLLPPFIGKQIKRQKFRYFEPSFKKRVQSVKLESNLVFFTSSLNESLLNHFEYKLEHLLKWGDLNSMAHSIESRVPFLDHRLVEKTLTLQPDKLIRNGISKRILRDAMKDLLPSVIAERRDKIGFESPNSRWLKSGTMKVFIEEILYSEQFVKRGYIESTKAQRAWISFLKGQNNIDKEIWKCINLELWFRNWIDTTAVSE